MVWQQLYNIKIFTSGHHTCCWLLVKMRFSTVISVRPVCADVRLLLWFSISKMFSDIYFEKRALHGRMRQEQTQKRQDLTRNHQGHHAQAPTRQEQLLSVKECQIRSIRSSQPHPSEYNKLHVHWIWQLSYDIVLILSFNFIPEAAHQGAFWQYAIMAGISLGKGSARNFSWSYSSLVKPQPI
jgi:hypothetical protein